VEKEIEKTHKYFINILSFQNENLYFLFPQVFKIVLFESLFYFSSRPPPFFDKKRQSPGGLLRRSRSKEYEENFYK
jgi:hypothetical protein